MTFKGKDKNISKTRVVLALHCIFLLCLRDKEIQNLEENCVKSQKVPFEPLIKIAMNLIPMTKETLENPKAKLSCMLVSFYIF